MVKQSATAKPRPPETLLLECGCKVGYGQLLKACETARVLEREIKAAASSGQTDQAERSAFALEEHVTEQMEQVEEADA